MEAADSLFSSLTSGVVVVTAALLVMKDPAVTAESVWATRVNTSFGATERLGFVQEMVPALPAPGVLQFQPEGLASETNVRPAGSVSVIVALSALSGPLLATIIW